MWIAVFVALAYISPLAGSASAYRLITTEPRQYVTGEPLQGAKPPSTSSARVGRAPPPTTPRVPWLPQHRVWNVEVRLAVTKVAANVRSLAGGFYGPSYMDSRFGQRPSKPVSLVPVDYYSLPFCRPADAGRAKQSLLSLVAGGLLQSAPYTFRMMVRPAPGALMPHAQPMSMTSVLSCL